MIKLKKLAKKQGGIADRIRPVSEVPNFTSMLIYGESGTGKTAFAATCPKPLLLLDLREKGTETIAKVEDVDVLSIESWDDFEEAFWMIDSDSKYETIVLDQITALQGVAMDKIRADNEMEPSDTFSKRDWGQMSGLMQTWLMNYRNLWEKEKNIIFLAHQRTFGGDDDSSGEDQIEPSVGARLSPSVSSFMNGAVSVIGNTFIRERFEGKGDEKKRIVEYRMRVGPHGYYRAKIRLPPGSVEVPDSIINPTYEKIMRLSRGESISKKVKRK